MASTTPVICPGDCCGGKCGGETVQASGPGFAGSQRRKTVTTTPCSVLVGQGWRGQVAQAFAPAQAEARLVRAVAA